MTEDIRTLTARLAEAPASLAFLELGETLRRRGQLDAALKVAQGGVSRYPALADAYDLLARILCDQDDLPGAFEAWADALNVDPLHPAALKGIGFLYFRAGERTAARQYLERAREADPDDPAISPALARLEGAAGASLPGQAPFAGHAGRTSAAAVAAGASPAAAPTPATPGETPTRAAPGTPPPAAATEPTADRRAHLEPGVLLVDASGMRLAGGLPDDEHDRRADAVAAELAGVSKEAARMTRLLELDRWESLAVESPDGHLLFVPPTADTILVAFREADVPMARLGLLADRAARDARAWLEHER